MPERTLSLSTEEIIALLESDAKTETPAFVSGLDKLRNALSQPEHQGDEKGAQEIAWEESGRSALDEMFEAVSPRDGSEGDPFTAAMLAPHAWAEIKRLRSAQPPAPALSDEEKEQVERVAQKIEEAMAGYGAGFSLADATTVRNLASQEDRGEESGVGAGGRGDGQGFSAERTGEVSRSSSPAPPSVDPALAQEWQKLMDAPIQTPGKVFVWHGDDEDKGTGEWMDGEQVNALIRKLKSDPSPGEEGRLRERLLDEDGPVLLALREAVSEEMDGGDFRDENGGLVAYNDPAVEALGDRLSNLVKDKLAGALPAAVSPSDSQGDQERCKRCGGSRVIVPLDASLPSRPCPDCNPAPTQVEGLPPELERALRDPSIVVDADRRAVLADGKTLAEHLEEWRDAPSNTVSADPSLVAPEPGDEEDWPRAVAIAVCQEVSGLSPAVSEDVDDVTRALRRYLPATSQDSSGLEELGADRDKWKITSDAHCSVLMSADDVLRTAGAKSPHVDEQADEIVQRLQRAETALEELAGEFADRSRVRPGETEESMGEKIAYEEASRVARERAAQLKEGKR